jgi:hypothetical protein
VTVIRIDEPRPTKDYLIQVSASIWDLSVPVPSTVGDARISRTEAERVAKAALERDPALLRHLEIRLACGALGRDLSRIYRARLRALSEAVLAEGVPTPKAKKTAKRRSA